MSAIAVAIEVFKGGVSGRTFVAKDESLLKIQETILKDGCESVETIAIINPDALKAVEALAQADLSTVTKFYREIAISS